MDEYAEAQLSAYLEKTDSDATVDEAKSALNDKIELVENRAMEDLDEQTKVDYAIGMLSADDIRESRVGGSGREMDLKILSIGQRGKWEDHPATEADTVTAHAVVHGPLGDNGEAKAAKAILLVETDHVDELTAKQKFHELNELTGTFEVEEAWNIDGFYRAYSTEDIGLTETEIDDLPDGRDAKNQMLRKLFPDVELAELAKDGKGLSAYDPDSGYTQDFGADIKRFTGTVVDYYIPDDRSWGRYTLMDESVTPEDIEPTAVVGDDQNVPGLTVWCQPDYHMNYGNQSVVDVYGVIEADDDGQITMRAAGVVPIIPMDMESEDDEADANTQATESKI